MIMNFYESIAQLQQWSILSHLFPQLILKQIADIISCYLNTFSMLKKKKHILTIPLA